MNELIKIEIKENKETVNARDLWKFLGSKQEFAHWIKGRINNFDFIEGEDFTIDKFIITTAIGVYKHNYYISISMAKELCMVENNSKGKEARKYFIECEKKVKEALPKTKIEWIKLALKTEEEKVELLEQKRICALD